MDTKNSDDVKIIDFLNLTPGKIDAVGMVDQCLRKYDWITRTVVEEYLRTQGVVILELSDKLLLIHRAGDPATMAILSASLEELPEFLASENDEIRQLAKWQLDVLT